MGLPDMDGRDVAHGLSVVCSASIIMIFAYAGTDIELDGMAAGAAAHLTKPFNLSDLRSLADRLDPNGRSVKLWAWADDWFES
ncbi:DNA-binding response OmpR family regulator [Paenarthrobacter nitroguajacolicus]|nr:DNA-binding response OmpR family regulator [Paenarthrobacter nitroguajacolicus]